MGMPVAMVWLVGMVVAVVRVAVTNIGRLLGHRLRVRVFPVQMTCCGVRHNRIVRPTRTWRPSDE